MELGGARVYGPDVVDDHRGRLARPSCLTHPTAAGRVVS